MFADVSLHWEINGLDVLLIASRVLHILGAIILLGGLIFVRHVVKPTVPPGTPDAFFDGRRASWAKWIGISTALLLLSGLFNYIYILMGLERMAKPYHMLAGIKILLSLALFMLAALLAGKTALAQRLREKFYVWLTVAVLLGIAIVILGAVLRTLPRTPKAANVEASIIAPAIPLAIQN